MPKQTPSNKKPAGKGARPPIDPLLLQRLDQLGQRRPATSQLPPPAPGTAAKAAASAASAAPGSQEAKLAAAAARAAAARAAKAGVPGARPAPAAGRKGKPAASSKVAALAVSVASTAALVGLFAQQDGNTSDSIILTGGTTAATAAGTATSLTLPSTVAPTTVAAATGNTAAPVTAAPVTAAPVTTAAAAPGIADGTYVGDGSRNRFGTVKVQVVYAGGQLTDVQILQYPNGDNRSIRINQYALPILINETIQAQSSNINGVGGATYTSNSYYQSLQSALDKAQSGIAG